ncbi:MAG: hypothetical protein WCC55_02575 [Nitrosotalea sp.]
MVSIDLNEEDMKIFKTIMQFSIVACPLGGVSQDVEIDSEKLEKLIAKMDRGLQSVLLA